MLAVPCCRSARRAVARLGYAIASVAQNSRCNAGHCRRCWYKWRCRLLRLCSIRLKGCWLLHAGPCSRCALAPLVCCWICWGKLVRGGRRGGAPHSRRRCQGRLAPWLLMLLMRRGRRIWRCRCLPGWLPHRLLADGVRRWRRLPRLVLRSGWSCAKRLRRRGGLPRLRLLGLMPACCGRRSEWQRRRSRRFWLRTDVRRHMLSSRHKPKAVGQVNRRHGLRW